LLLIFLVEVPESVLVRRIVQNIHPHVRSLLVFAAEPKSIKDLYSLASQVAEGRALDDRRKDLERGAPTVNPTRGKRDLSHVSMAGGETRRSVSRAVICWKCSGYGHVSEDCPSSVTSVPRNLGNEGGARQRAILPRSERHRVNNLGVEPVLLG
jgi:hypothetical protein